MLAAAKPFLFGRGDRYPVDHERGGGVVKYSVYT